MLERLAAFTESRQALQQQVRNALIYPIALVVTAAGIISFMLSYVVPKIVDIFENYGQELPLLTRMMLWSSEFLREQWFILIVAIVLVVFGVRRLLRKEVPRRRYHRMLLRLPHHRPPDARHQHGRFTQT